MAGRRDEPPRTSVKNAAPGNDVLAAISEFGGGLAWIAGLLTPLASFGIACTMVVAVRLHAVVMGDPFVSQTGGRAYELGALFLSIAVLLLLAGPGRFSLDGLLFGENEKVSRRVSIHSRLVRRHSRAREAPLL